jgi:pSer/pThr/pTyr-binding forkhead associated (FHA) protein
MPYQLICLSAGPNILLEQPITLFGRDDDCDVVLESKRVSRRHCVVAVVESGLVVRDLGSTNGISVNGTKVAASKLLPGDELAIGNFQFKVFTEFQQPQPPVPPPA